MAKKFDKVLEFFGIENNEDVVETEEDFTAAPVDEEPVRPMRKRKEPTELAAVEPRGRRNKPALGVVAGGQGRQNMVLYQPQSNEDTQSIIDYMKNHRAVIINLETLEKETAQRILDYVSGASYALNGKIHKISNEIFLLAPADANVTNNLSVLTGVEHE